MRIGKLTAVMTGNRLIQARPVRGQRWGLAVIVIAALTRAAPAGPVAVKKQEGLLKYGQNILHGPLVGATDTHVLTPQPADFWDSPVTLTGTAGPGGDSITASHRARHKVAPHGGEAQPGPWWNAPAITPPPAVLAITIAGASGTRDHGHTDYFNHMMAVLWGVGGRIVGYAYASSAAHDPISCSAKSAALRGSEENPPAHSQTCGAASFIFDAGTNTFVISVSVFGIERNNLLSAAIHAGGPGEDGPVIFDLGPSPQWDDNPGLGMGRVVQEAPFPLSSIPDLMVGRTYVNIRTTTFPAGEIRGQLVDVVMVGLGDVNNDGVTNGKDIQPFVNCMLLEPEGSCLFDDMNGDGRVDAADVDLFIQYILSH